jgi:hypothetical protein
LSQFGKGFRPTLYSVAVKYGNKFTRTAQALGAIAVAGLAHLFAQGNLIPEDKSFRGVRDTSSRAPPIVYDPVIQKPVVDFQKPVFRFSDPLVNSRPKLPPVVDSQVAPFAWNPYSTGNYKRRKNRGLNCC